MTHVLVTGGAGYIGSHACKRLAQAGYIPVAFDNLSTGWRDAVKYGPLVEGDLTDQEAVRAAFETYRPSAVLHFAALSQVAESVREPGRYWRNNSVGALTLFEVAAAAGCSAIILSSTCAVYGDQDGVFLSERSPLLPNSPYGKMKLAIEHMLQDIAAAHEQRFTIFRYFNVAGADHQGEIGEFHQPETHLVPLVLEAVQGKRSEILIHGTDYPTPDGSCVRDYVHVEDLVEAHIDGLRQLLDGRGSEIYNLGTGAGFSVKEVIAQAKRLTNIDFKVVEGPRRAGDCASLICDPEKARSSLGWTPNRSDLQQILHDAWRWHQGHGYDR